MAKKIRVWDGSAWQDVAPALPYTAVHSAQASMPSTAVDGQIWLDTDASVPSTTVTRWYKLPAAGTTTLSGNDDNSIPLAYTPGYEQVFLNGTLLSRSAADYTATTGTSVVLSSAIVAGDIVEIICPLQITTTDTYTQAAANNKFVQNTGYFAAGKNKIINGDFGVNQRGFTTSVSSFAFLFDRWQTRAIDGTSTFTAQTFTSGSAPVAGYESTNYLRVSSSGQSAASTRTAISQPIEDVRTFAGQTATFSFWAKSESGSPSVSVYLAQNWVNNFFDMPGQKVTINSSWNRYSITFQVPAMAGQTIGLNNKLTPFIFTSAGSDWNSQSASLGIQSTTIDFWGFQFEAGSVPTSFSTSTGSIQGELAACQRYYWRNSTISGTYGLGFATSATASRYFINFPTAMRIAPTSVEYGANVNVGDLSTYNYAPTSLVMSTPTPLGTRLDVTVASGQTAYRPQAIFGAGAADFIGFLAEL